MLQIANYKYLKWLSENAHARCYCYMYRFSIVTQRKEKVWYCFFSASIIMISWTIGVDEQNPDSKRPEEQWWTEYVKEADHKQKLELSGKLVLLFDILRMAEGLCDKV